MERNFSASEMIERLRTGEKIKCTKCGKGHYTTNKKYIETSHSFWCDNCNDLLHVTSSVTVE